MEKRRWLMHDTLNGVIRATFGLYRNREHSSFLKQDPLNEQRSVTDLEERGECHSIKAEPLPLPSQCIESC